MRKKMDNRGAFPFVAVLVVALIVVAVLVVVGLFKGGFGKGGGKGDGEGLEKVSGSVIEESESSETQPETEEVTFLGVSVSENGYLYQNQKMELDALIEQLKKDAADGLKVKVTDNNASRQAYKKLVDALKENKINFVEAEEEESK